MNKKISQFNEVIAIDNNTAFVPVIQGNPLFNAVIKPETFIDTTGGMLSKNYVGTGATESVNNSDNLGNIPAEEYVTYTGATKNIDLNDKQLNNVNSISLNNTETIYWDNDEDALAYTLPDGGSLAIGKEIFDYYTNIDTVPLVAGDIVSIYPISGNRKGIKRTDVNNTDSVKNVIGMVTVPSISVNNIGRVTKIGMVHELNTDAYTEGTQLYVSPSNPGKWINIPPNAPNYQVSVGSVVVKHHQVGVIDLHITYNCKLEDLANVNGTTPVNGSLLVYDNNVFDFTKNINDLADKTDLQNHINAVNPHNITPEQLGVYTQEDVDTLLNNKK